jgi:adenosine deaminase
MPLQMKIRSALSLENKFRGSSRQLSRAASGVVVWCLLSAITFGEPRMALTPAEAKTERAFESARKSGPLTMRAFLMQMPKGADLHIHLSGAVYAESWIRAAGEDGLCVNPASMSFERSAAMTRSVPPQPVCGGPRVAASSVPDNAALYDGLVDAFSMRSFVASAGVSGHDHFFATFARFGGTSPSHGGEWLDEVATRAAAQNEQYLELMETPDFKHTATLVKELGWDPDLKKLRDELFSRGLRDDVAVAREHVQQALDSRNALEKCGTAEAAPSCKVEIRFLYQVLRGFPPEQVFAQTLLACEVASADPRFVGLNFVMPEDGYRSMADYRMQMQMLDYLHAVYPKVHISLHAGELAPGLVPPDGLTFHIRSAVEQGHAERIGHGVDVMYEDRPYELLKEMAGRHVLVEINLTSNEVILGVKGIDHPLPIYLRYGVPVALSTDDEGVSRIDLTHEYVSAAMTYGLTYRDLKKMVRASLEHSFLSGESLWKDGDGFSQAVQPCAAQALGAANPAGRCGTFLQSSEKARQQWELERRFRVFEAAQ